MSATAAPPSVGDWKTGIAPAKTSYRTFHGLLSCILDKQQLEGRMCPQCGEQMWLARIESYEPNHDEYTFECPQ